VFALLMWGSLVFCTYLLGLVSPALGAYFRDTRNVKAKGKTFSCQYKLRYDGSLTVNSKWSRVTCKPDSRGSFGTVTQTFEINGFSVDVVHAVKKGRDTIKNIKVEEIVVTTVPTEQSCSCKLPLTEGSSSETGRKLENAAGRVLERKRRSFNVEMEGRTFGGLGFPTGGAFESLVKLVFLASLSALVTYGKSMLLQSLGMNVTGRTLETTYVEEPQEMILNLLNKASDRNLIGGIIGGLGSLIGGGATESSLNTTNTTDFTEAAISEAIAQYLANGGLESILSNLLASEDIGQYILGIANTLLNNIDVESTIETLTSQLGSDFGEIISTVEQAVLSGNIIGVISNLLGGISEAEIEGFLENISSGAIEMAMNCECL